MTSTDSAAARVLPDATATSIAAQAARETLHLRMPQLADELQSLASLIRAGAKGAEEATLVRAGASLRRLANRDGELLTDDTLYTLSEATMLASGLAIVAKNGDVVYPPSAGRQSETE